MLIASVGIGAAVQQTDIYFLIKKNFSIYSKVYENVALEYVDEVDPEVLMRNGLNAMLETLDPYTVLYDEAQNQEAEILSTGNYAGIGIEAGFRDGKVVVIAPAEDGPADRAGIRAGDEIIEIDGISTADLSPEQAQNLTLGEVDSKVNLKIIRLGSTQELDFELIRERIVSTNLGYSGLIGEAGNIGYIKLNEFGLRSADEIRTALDSLEAQQELKGLVLDLRDNPGGILQEAVRIVDKFIEPGVMVVETKGRLAEYNEVYSTREPVRFNKPLTILMNGGSASASEVTSGALQDLDRAVIIGEQSFGKGLVQIVKPLPYNTSLKITISRYYTPSGRSIQSLQYTHSSKNTPVARPDSVIRTFRTKNGREVLEGRGIEPDVDLKPEALSDLQVALFQQGIYFDFATKYISENSTLTTTGPSDELFNDFVSYLEESGFSYQTSSDQALAELESELKDNSAIASTLSSVAALIEESKVSALEADKTLIKKILFEEILSRYEGRSARIQQALSLDNHVQKAIELINNPSELNKILSGN